jgi:hypothetical protein
VEHTEDPTIPTDDDPRALATINERAQTAGKFAVSMQGQFLQAMKAVSGTMGAFRQLIEALSAMDTPGSAHVVSVDDHGIWTVHHPLSCRQPTWEALADCQVPEAIANVEELPGGWHAVDVQHDGECVFVPLDEVVEPDVDMHEETAGYHPHTGAPDDPTALLRERARTAAGPGNRETCQHGQLVGQCTECAKTTGRPTAEGAPDA